MIIEASCSSVVWKLETLLPERAQVLFYFQLVLLLQLCVSVCVCVCVFSLTSAVRQDNELIGKDQFL